MLPDLLASFRVLDGSLKSWGQLKGDSGWAWPAPSSAVPSVLLMLLD